MIDVLTAFVLWQFNAHWIWWVFYVLAVIAGIIRRSYDQEYK
jgi:hypothetical protein